MQLLVVILSFALLTIPPLASCDCMVAASCEYPGGSTSYEYRPLPTNADIKNWGKSELPKIPTKPKPIVRCGDPGWFTGEGDFQYKIFDAETDWFTARQFCNLHDAEVPYKGVKDQKSLKVLTDFLRQHGSIKGYWIGMTDVEKEGSWKWIDGSSVTGSMKSNWADKQPDNKDSRQHCGWISRDMNYKWDDGDCSVMFNVLCERKI